MEESQSSKKSTSSREKSRTVDAEAERAVAIGGNVAGGTIETGDKISGDNVAGDKNIYINQPASAAVKALHQLRAPVIDFVGREREIDTLSNALRGGRHAGISGMGGIGKTELALLVAQRVAGDYPDAQFFLSLRGTDAKARAPEEVLATCIRAFIGPEASLPDDRDQLLQRYRSELSGKRVLLLLDNAADDAQVQLLLPPPGSVVLVTSRRALTLPGLTRLKLNPLTSDEGKKLLLEIAPHAATAAAQICELCGYLPLAIRAAGSLLAVTDDLDPVAYAAQLNDERNRLERIGKEGVEVDVAASFNLSYERLTPEAALVFRLLGVFPATFDAAAEEAICADVDHKQLSELVRRSLVVYDASTKRYRLHDLARLFANSKLTDEENAIGDERHAKHYKDVLTAANNLYLQGGTALARGLALLDLEWNNIETGHAWVAAQDIETAEDEIVKLGMTYPNAAVHVLNLRMHARELIRWMEIALAAARRLNHRGYEAAMLLNLGTAYWSLGENDRAIELYEQRLTIARAAGDRRGEGNALGNLGNTYYALNEYEKAADFYEQTLPIVRELGDQRGEGMVLSNLGSAYKELGETQKAIESLDRALKIAREIGDRRGEGNALGNLGNAYEGLGETKRTLECYEQQLAIAREIGDLRGENTALWNMSLSLYQQGKRAEAVQLAEQSLAIHEQIEDPYTAEVRAHLARWRAEI